MLSSAAFVALAASPAMGAYVGFNYGATFTTGAVKVQSDYETEFKAAQALVSAPDTFSSARLYTMIQGGTTNSVNEALPAAVSTKTSLLLGLWASAGDANFANEIIALKSAISTYGSSLAGQIAGISVGSEDLYRISPTGILNMENPGASPDTIVNYIGQVKAAIANTPFANVPVGHVDTWTAWVNSSNSAVASAADWIGVDAYPYFQDTVANSISTGASLFNSAVDQTKAAVGGKPVWITETGWPVSGPTRGQAVASVENAKAYWDQVGCSLFGTTNTWWYTLQDAAPQTPSPSFGIVGSTLGSNPIFDLSCNASSSSSSSATGSVTGSATVLASASASADATAADGGSPGISGGVGGATGSGSAATATVTGAGSSPSGGSSSGGSSSGGSSSGGSGSGGSGASGASGSGSSGSGSGSEIGSNGTTTSTVPSPSSSIVTTNTAGTIFVSSAAAFVALMAASLVL